MGNCFGSERANTKREPPLSGRSEGTRPTGLGTTKTSSGRVLGSAATTTTTTTAQREVLAKAAEQRTRKDRKRSTATSIRVKPADTRGERLSPAEQRRQESLVRDWQS
ncbi:hypothetical protein CCYA_CCYA07G2162 [Cyanidiococcus yangmingshanensis]|nr:hypothetical protein CCYA_CCYA07G2162 [Cyanidiococcus yangmingshanensis]